MNLQLAPVALHLVDPQVAERIVPPPTEALDAAERERLLGSEPLSLLHVLGPEGEGGAAAGRSAGAVIRGLIADGHYHDRGPVFAVHELRTAEHRQVGVIAGVPLRFVRDDRVRPHEQIRVGRERNLADFLEAAGMDVSPVMLTHEVVPELDAIIAEVVSGPTDLAFRSWHGVRHRVWIVDDPVRQEQVRAAAAVLDALTIVDGHHRVAATVVSAERGGPAAPRTLLAELVPDRELQLVGYDRRVATGDPTLLRTMGEALPTLGEVDPLPDGVPQRPEGLTEVLAGTAQGWSRLRFRDPPPLLPDALPAALLQDRLLDPYLGIEDPRTDPRLEVIPGVDGLGVLDRARREPGVVVFAPRAVTAAELLAVAEAGRTLPPKSTFVHPKPGPGVVLRSRDRMGTVDP